MAAFDPYRIPGTESPERRQEDEHPRVEQRSRRALIIAGAAVLVALIAAGFSGLQWEAADRQADIADRALKLAEQSAKEQAADIERSRKAAESSASAAEKLATSNASMASTMRRQLDAANAQVSVMQRQFENTDRPWIKIIEVKPRGNGPISSLGFADSRLLNIKSPIQQVSLNFEVLGKNIGHSTALNVQIFVELGLFKWKNGYSAEVEAEGKRFCNVISKNSKPVSSGGPALYPEEPYSLGMGTDHLITQNDMNFFNDIPDGGPYVIPVLFGCVDYQFQSSDKHHLTQFVYEVFHAHEPRTRFFLVGEEVKADDLLFIKNTSDDYVN